MNHRSVWQFHDAAPQEKQVCGHAELQRFTKWEDDEDSQEDYSKFKPDEVASDCKPQCVCFTIYEWAAPQLSYDHTDQRPFLLSLTPVCESKLKKNKHISPGRLLPRHRPENKHHHIRFLSVDGRSCLKKANTSRKMRNINVRCAIHHKTA